MCLDPISIFSTVNPGVLQVAGGVALDGTLRFIEDQAGADSALLLSTGLIGVGLADIQFTSNLGYGIKSANGTRLILIQNSLLTVQELMNIGSGTITSNGSLTVKSFGGNIFSGRNSTNTEVASIENSGNINGNILNSTNSSFGFKAQNSSMFYWNSRGGFRSPGDGIINLLNTAESGFTRLILGLNDNTGASIVKNGNGLQFKDGDGTNFTTIEPLEILTRAPSGGIAKKIKFGERLAVSDGALTALGIDSQWLVEIEAVNYYLLGGSTQFT